MVKEAVAYGEQAAKLDPTLGRYALGALYARLGRADDARKIAAELRKKPGQWDFYGLAMIYAALGDRQEALTWVQAAYDSRHIYTPWILAGFPREFSSLYGEPKFQELVRRVKFPVRTTAD